MLSLLLSPMLQWMATAIYLINTAERHRCNAILVTRKVKEMRLFINMIHACGIDTHPVNEDADKHVDKKRKRKNRKKPDRYPVQYVRSETIPGTLLVSPGGFNSCKHITCVR